MRACVWGLCSVQLFEKQWKPHEKQQASALMLILGEGSSNSNTRRPGASHHETERSFEASFLRCQLPVALALVPASTKSNRGGLSDSLEPVVWSCTMRLPFKLNILSTKGRKNVTRTIPAAFCRDKLLYGRQF